MKQIAIVLAAGYGKRMNSTVAKQYMLLKDKPVLYYSLKKFEDSFVDDIILVTDNVFYCQQEIVEKYGFQKVRKLVTGGAERYHSVHNGLIAAETLLQGEDACIYIHDGARPFVEEAILLRAKESVEQYGTGVVAMPVKDTIKIVDENCFVASTPNRFRVWQMQTPQCFLFHAIKSAYDTLILKEQELLKKGVAITDDAMVMEQFGNKKVKLVEGNYQNIKITTPEDLLIAESFLV